MAWHGQKQHSVCRAANEPQDTRGLQAEALHPNSNTRALCRHSSCDVSHTNTLPNWPARNSSRAELFDISNSVEREAPLSKAIEPFKGLKGDTFGV